MKKVLIVVCALLLALPAVSFAGSATSRWDLTIGGFVKVDAGYTNQAAGPSPSGLEQYFPDRNNSNGNQNASNKAGSFGMATGQTTLNFLVKGPDTWGAKTTAFVQGNFVGQTNNNGTNTGTRTGTFTLSHAYMDFTWASTKLTVGQNWQLWGFQPSYTFLGLYDLLMAGRGNTVPQISITQNFTKSFYASFGIQEPYNFKDQNGGSANLGLANNFQTGTGINTTAGAGTNTRVTSQMPDFAAEIGFKSDACGRIGPNIMQFAVGGFWGQDTLINIDPTSSARTTYNSQHLNRWGAAFKGFVPIIPEKNLNKAGALSVSGSVFSGQNLANWFLGARNIISLIPYDRPGANADYAVPVTTGGWAQVSYYFTDKVYTNGLFGYNRNYESAIYKEIYPNQINQWQQWIINVIYDVNPAVRFGVEYSYTAATFNGKGLNNGGNAAPFNGQLAGYGVPGGSTATPGTATYLDSKGSVQNGRISFWYFF
jgi:hypothetical protein